MPLDATGSGVPVGPLVIVTVSTIELTCSVQVPVAECVNASLTVTDSVQDCCAPVALAGTFHVGAAVVALGVKLPFPSPPVHDALQA